MMSKHEAKQYELSESFNNVQHPKKRAFLIAFAGSGNISAAAKIARIDRTLVYIWKKKDPEFAAAFEVARQLAIDTLEDEAIRRAVEGVEKPVFYGGKKVATVKEYSDTLLIFLLKGNRPEKYIERIAGEITGKSGGPLEIVFVSQNSGIGEKNSAPDVGESVRETTE